MASLKEIRGRIGSVKGTLKITSAMRLISSAKLHGAQNAIGNMLPYERALHSILEKLMAVPSASAAAAPYAFSQGKKTAVVVIASNQSLCGAFNSNILKAFQSLELDEESTQVYAIGKKLLKPFSKTGYIVEDCSNMGQKADWDQSTALARRLVDGFVSGQFGKVLFVYAHYENNASQPIRVETYLPMAVPCGGCDAAGDAANENAAPSGLPDDYITEPDPLAILKELLPKVLCLKLHTVLLDACAAEHAARTMAMQLASDNAEDLLGELSLQYNKLRQQAITSEILDLLGGQTAN